MSRTYVHYQQQFMWISKLAGGVGGGGCHP
jgi:hypothetical protein